MKNNLSPTVVIAVIVVAVIAIAGIGFWIWRAPSVTAAPGVKTDAQGVAVQNPTAGGGPSPSEVLKIREERARAGSSGGAGSSP